MTSELALIIAIISLGGSIANGLLTYLITYRRETKKLRREGYGEAVAALYAWYEYPFQIRRRLSNSQEMLDRLIQLGNENQQRIARSLAWMALDRKDAYVRYQKLVDKVKAVTAEYIKEAWRLSPIRYSVEINLGSWGPESIDDKVKDFLNHMSPTKQKWWCVRRKKKSAVKSEDKYITWNDLRTMFTGRFIGNILALVGASIFAVTIMFNNRNIDQNSPEWDSVITLWGVIFSLIISLALVSIFECLSRGFLKSRDRNSDRNYNIIFGLISPSLLLVLFSGLFVLLFRIF